MSADHATESLRKILESGEYECIPDVPLLDEHEKYDKDGNLVRRFGKKELEDLCEKCNERFEKTGDLSPFGPGHTIPGAPETAQPIPWGFAHKWHVGTFGPSEKTAAMADFYVKREVVAGWKHDGSPAFAPGREAMATYPRRSVELWVKDGIVDWIALMRRTPQRDLGLLTYGRHEGERIFYSMEQDTMDPTAAPDAQAPDADFEGKVMRCIKAAFPGLDKMLADFAAQQQAQPPVPGQPGLDAPGGDPGLDAPGGDLPQQNAAGAGAMVSATNAAPPSFPPKKDEATRMQRDSDAIRYHKETETLKAKVAQLEQARADDLVRYSRADAERCVVQLEGEGYVMDRVKEVERFAKMSETERVERAEEIRRYYRQDGMALPPTGDLLPIGSPPGRGQNGEPTAREADGAIRYMRQHGINDFDVALAHVRKAQ